MSAFVNFTELEQEVEKWKSWASEVIYWSHSASKDTLESKKLITTDNKPTISNVRDFGKEISELKEKNKNVEEANEELREVIDDLENTILHLESDKDDLEKEACDYESMKKHRDTLLEESEESFMKIHKLEEENEKLKETIDDTKEFLKVCDRNTDGYYEHYETRQIATRFEGGYQKDD